MELVADRAQLVRATANSPDEIVPSPCISVCRMHPVSGLCLGCFRTLDEIAAWSRMDEAGKRAIWAVIEERLANA